MIEVPGKLVVMGEYAVLDGAPALVQAVLPGVCCEVEPCDTRRTTTPTGDSRFVDAALDAIDAPPAHYRFSSATHELAGKPGLGGSAAATVAALLAGGADPDPRALTRLGIAVHRAVQGSGSGIDIAASAWGGALAFTASEVEPGVVPVVLPEFLTLYSGQSAETGPRIRRYRAWTNRDDFVRQSAALVEAFPSDPIPTLGAAWRLLCSMAHAAGIAYRTPAIDAIVALAEAHGGAAKPSGAGGGDSVIAIGPDLRQLRTAMLDAGFSVVQVRPAPIRDPHA